jgi:hypothetical protein
MGKGWWWWWWWWLTSAEVGIEERVVEVGELELAFELALELALVLRREEREGDCVRSLGCLTGDFSLRMKEARRPREGCGVGRGSMARKAGRVVA